MSIEIGLNIFSWAQLLKPFSVLWPVYTGSKEIPFTVRTVTDPVPKYIFIIYKGKDWAKSVNEMIPNAIQYRQGSMQFDYS